MKLKFNNNFSRFFLLTFFILNINTLLISQTPGLILKPASSPGNIVLDPDGDGYVSKKTNGLQLGFTNPPNNDVLQSEIPFVQIFRPDPIGDLLRGPSGGFSDIVGVDASGNNAILGYYDGTNLLYRFRIGGFANNSKSYSILIDTDEKFGFSGTNADPNAVSGNPGFEIEIVLKTNFEVSIYNIDGTTNPVHIVSYPYSSHCQKSIAKTMASGNADYFYDFFVPFIALKNIHNLNIDENTTFRYVATTGMSPHPIIGSNVISDIGGITSGNSIDQIFMDIIQNQTPTSTLNFNSQGVLDRSLCPTVSQVNVIHSQISGNTSELAGTIIKVRVFSSDGSILLSSAQISTSSQNWNIPLNNFSPSIILQQGQIVRVTATAPNKGESFFSCNEQRVINCTVKSNFNGVTIGLVGGNKGYRISTTKPVGTIFTLYNSNFEVMPTTDFTPPNNVNPRTTVSNPQTFEFSCQTGQCFSNGVYYFTVQEPGQCISDFLQNCDYVANGTSTTPTIQGNIFTTSNSLTVTFSPSNSNLKTITLFINDIRLTSVQTSNTNSYTFTGLNFSSLQCNNVRVSISDLNRCVSFSPTVIVQKQSIAPAITTSGCLPTPVTTINGISGEATGAEIEVFRVGSPNVLLGTAILQAGGLWSLTNLNLTSGQQIFARVKASSLLCLTQSLNSDTITIQTQTNISNYTLSFNGDIYSDDISVSGNISGGNYPVTIRLYLDEALVGNSTTINSAGQWTVTGFNSFDLAAGGKLQIRLTSTTQCESELSSIFEIIKCRPPAEKEFHVERIEVCRLDSISLHIKLSERGTIYTPVYYNTITGQYEFFGYSKIGTGYDLYLSTYPFTTSPTFINVLAQVFPFEMCYGLVAPNKDYEFEVFSTDAGEIDVSQLVIWGGNTNRINEITAGDVEGGIMSYQWQKSYDPVNGFIDIVGANDPYFDPPTGPTQTTYYRRTTINSFSNFECKEFSNIHTLTVWSNLPISLESFDAKIIENYSQIEWSTLSEINNNYFEILHSTDGVNFKTIGIVYSKSSNSNSRLNYELKHLNPRLGFNYYRLKQYDFDGKFSFSDIKFVKFIPKLNFDLFPNPATEEITLKIKNNNDFDYTEVSIFNIFGSKVYSQIFDNINSEVNINVSFLKPGTYNIVIESNQHIENKKLVIIK